MSNTEFTLALVQMLVVDDKAKNIKHASDFIRKAVKECNPKIVCLPEVFNVPYGPEYFDRYAEVIPTGETCRMMSDIAKELKIYLAGGTIIERESEGSNTLYNTMTIWGPDGKLICKYRKCHLFNVDIKGGIRFQENSRITPGKEFVTFDMDGVKVGLAVCFDMQFEEMHRIYRNMGVQMFIYPVSYHTSNGPLHWELVTRARAMDTQSFVVGVSLARDPSFSFPAYGHSMIVDPWGQILATTNEKEAIIYSKIDMSVLHSARSQVPLYNARRTDMYDTINK